jgi:hypothetical protein
MSSFGFLNVSGIDGFGNGSGGAGGFPGGIDKSVQFNDGGLAFGGVSTFLYDKVAATLTVDKAKPNQIIDGSNSVGTAGQVLSSTGSGLAYVTPVPVVPGAPVNSVQFNSAGAFGGDSNFIFDSATDVLNVNGNVGIGSLSAPTDRLVVTGANAVVRVKSTTFNQGTLVLEDSSLGVKQLELRVNTDTADFLSIQQGVAFRNFRFNTASDSACIAVGTTAAQAQGGFMCSNRLSNRKIILNSQANDEHQNYSLGVNSNLFRFQLPSTTPRYGWFAATGSGASNELMTLTGTGNVGIGTSTPATALEVNGTTTMTSLKTATILDNTNAEGTAAQLLSSTGTALSWINPPAVTVPGGLTSNVQFNLAGAFGGTPNFTFTDATSHLKTAGLLTVGSTSTTVPRIFAQSGSALWAISSWDDQWILAGGGNGDANSANIGMGYNNTITSGIIGCSEPSSGYKPIIYSAASHDFKTNGSTRMTVTQTGGGDGLLTVPILEATQIRDGLSNTGTNGQFLSSTGIGLLWTTPLPYADSLSAVGAFITTAPVPADTPTMVFNVPRAGVYRITTNVLTYPTASNTTVTVETYWRESVAALPYNLALTSTSFQNNINIHQAFPGKSGYVTLPAGSIDILIRTGANTGSNASDPVNVDLLECTI